MPKGEYTLNQNKMPKNADAVEAEERWTRARPPAAVRDVISKTRYEVFFSLGIKLTLEEEARAV